MMDTDQTGEQERLGILNACLLLFFNGYTLGNVKIIIHLLWFLNDNRWLGIDWFGLDK